MPVNPTFAEMYNGDVVPVWVPTARTVVPGPRRPLPLLEASAPRKPAWGEPCNGCGLCCRAQVCLVGRELFGVGPTGPCPALRWGGSRHWCGVVEELEREGRAMPLAALIGVGGGCDCNIPGG